MNKIFNFDDIDSTYKNGLKLNVFDTFYCSTIECNVNNKKSFNNCPCTKYSYNLNNGRKLLASNYLIDETFEIVASDRESGDNFGRFDSIDIYENYLIVGAYRENTRGNNAGAAYIYKRINNEWIESVELKPISILQGDRFGGDVAINDEFAVVGMVIIKNLKY